MIGVFSFSTGSPISIDDAGGGLAVVKGPMIRAGVWNGIYVPADAIREAQNSILGRYWLDGHRDEETATQWHEIAMGLVTGVEVKGERADTFIEIEPFPDKIPETVRVKMEAEEPMGVSADFKANYVDEIGEWEGKPYSRRVLSMYYLHVARVPLGACSVEDGCWSQMSFEKGVGIMKLKGKPTVKEVQQAEGDDENDETGVQIVSFNKPEDIEEFVNGVQQLDDPVDALEQMLGLADWVTENWKAGTGPFILATPVEEGLGAEGVGEVQQSKKPLAKKKKVVAAGNKPKAVEVGFKDDDEDEDGKGKKRKSKNPTRDFAFRQLRSLLPNISDERMAVYEKMDDEALIAIIEDLQESADTVDEGVEEDGEEETLVTGGGAPNVAEVAQARKATPATPIKLKSRKKKGEVSFYAEHKIEWNKRLGKRPRQDRHKKGGDK